MAAAALAQENIWFNKAQCEDAERMYFEKLSGAKTTCTEEASNDQEEEANETQTTEKVWSNKSECEDAEAKLQERLAQMNGGYKNPANGERTFIMLKPDAVQRGLIGTIIDRFEARGFKLLAAKFMNASESLLKQHYADLSKKGFFGELIRYMGSGPVVPMVFQGLHAVKQGRTMLGATNPKDSDPGTIRGDFCVDVGRNIIHGSDSVESANKEIKLWFTDEEISSWRSVMTEWVYEEEEMEETKASNVNVDGLVAQGSEVDMALASKLSALEIENKTLKKVTEDLKTVISKLESRVAALEGGKPASAPAAAPAAAAADDDDVDLFGSDSEEDDEEKARVTAERLKAYADKKSKKPALIAKTSVLFDVKPWDDETDMNEMLKACKSIEMEGLVWGANKLVPVGYGISKLQLMCVVEDEKVSIEELQEKMADFEDFVQSVDVAAMNKI